MATTATNRGNIYTDSIDINTNAVGFMVGKGRKNLKELYTRYPDVTIKIVSTGELTSFSVTSQNVNRLEQCKDALSSMRDSALTIYDTVQYRNRVQKEKNQKRYHILAANKIRDSIEAEMMVRHKEALYHKLEAVILDDTLDGEQKSVIEPEVQQYVKKNKFAMLDVDE